MDNVQSSGTVSEAVARHARNAALEEAEDALIELQTYYTQKEINADVKALFWTRGVQRSLDVIRALKEEMKA